MSLLLTSSTTAGTRDDFGSFIQTRGGRNRSVESSGIVGRHEIPPDPSTRDRPCQPDRALQAR